MLPHQGLLTNDARRRKFQRWHRGRPSLWGIGLAPRGLSRRGPSLYCARRVRRGGRVAEGARLESVYTGNRIVGSNPTLSASVLSKTFSSSLQPQANGIVGGYLPYRSLHLHACWAGPKHSPEAFFSKPPYFRPMLRFSENYKRSLLRTRFHVPDFE